MLAVTVKESVNPEISLEEPKEVIDELMPRPETPGETKNTQAVREREARDRLKRDNVTQNSRKKGTRT